MGTGGEIAVVTDSTAYLPDGLAEELRISVVPLYVIMGGASGEEGVDITPDQLAAALRERRQPVSTSRPTPSAFAHTYRRCLDSGAKGVVSIHLSRELSGTWDAARLAAEDVDPSCVKVIDSRSAGMGLGFAVLAAAELARAGAELDDVVGTGVDTAAATVTLFYVDTLEFLRRGGRIGAAAAVLGTALAVKPLLHVVDGRIVALEKVRTASKAIARLAEVAVERAGGRLVDIAVQHLAAPERAEGVASVLRERIPRLRRMYTSEVGAVVGAHVGPGLIGVVVAPAPAH
ncbi:MAG: DegV family protein [Geodermatophilaceae bacterium]|nr:DegV family protein [Geodermatophilaceae bacterium]